MKEGKLLDRLQAVLHLYIYFILATIQEHNLKSELACNGCSLFKLQFDFNIFPKHDI